MLTTFVDHGKLFQEQIEQMERLDQPRNSGSCAVQAVTRQFMVQMDFWLTRLESSSALSLRSL